MDSDVDAAGLDCPDGCWDKEADLTGELGIFVLFNHLVLQCALDRVEAAGLPGRQDQHVHIWRQNNIDTVCDNGPRQYNKIKAICRGPKYALSDKCLTFKGLKETGQRVYHVQGYVRLYMLNMLTIKTC